MVIRHLDSAVSFELNFWRSAFNALALAVGISLMRGPGLWRKLTHSPKTVWISGVCWSIMFTAFMVAITLTTVANVLIAMALSPLISGLLARFFLRHRLPVATWAAIAVAGLGIIFMFFHEVDTSLSLVGCVIALAIPLAGAVNFTILQYVGLSKGLVDASDNEPAQDMLHTLLIGAILSTLMTLPLSLPFQSSIHDISLLALLGIFQLAIPCLLVVRLSREIPAPEILLLAQLEVVFGVMWEWLWAGEHLSVNTLRDGMLVLGALSANAIIQILGERKAKKVKI